MQHQNIRDSRKSHIKLGQSGTSISYDRQTDMEVNVQVYDIQEQSKLN
jgi:hypothetical protein